jgi:hypothetical protein
MRAFISLELTKALQILEGFKDRPLLLYGFVEGIEDRPFLLLLYIIIMVMFCNIFVGLAYQGKDIIVFRFIIEYSSSLRDFYRPLGNNNSSIFII